MLIRDRVMGVLEAVNKREGIFDERDETILSVIASHAAIAIENARLFEASRESQEAATRSEAELRALFAAMTDVIIVLDKEGRYVRIAPTNPSLLIRPPGELIGQLTNNVLPSEAARSVMVAIEEALRTGETVNVEYALEINQKAFWFEGAISKLNEEQVFLVARDTTDRKSYEESIRRRNDTWQPRRKLAASLLRPLT